MVTEEEYEKYKRVAYLIGSKFMKGFPYLREDIQSSIDLGLCEGGGEESWNI